MESYQNSKLKYRKKNCGEIGYIFPVGIKDKQTTIKTLWNWTIFSHSKLQREKMNYQIEIISGLHIEATCNCWPLLARFLHCFWENSPSFFPFWDKHTKHIWANFWRFHKKLVVGVQYIIVLLCSYEQS